MNNKLDFNKFTLLFFVGILFIGLYLFVYENDKRNIMLSEKNIHILFGSNNKEVTIKYDGNAFKHIKEYSFDGGETWSKSNIALIEDVNKLSIQVKDNNNQIYSLKYKNSDKEQIDTVYLLKIADKSIYEKNHNSFSYINVMNHNSLNIDSSLKCHSIIDIINYEKTYLKKINNFSIKKI